MITVAGINSAVKRLPKKKLARFRQWFAGHDAMVWELPIKEDTTGGTLDALVREARRDHRAGRAKAL